MAAQFHVDFTLDECEVDVSIKDKFHIEVSEYAEIVAEIIETSPVRIFQSPKTTASYQQLIGDINNSNTIFSFGEPYKSGTIEIEYQGVGTGMFIELDITAGTFQLLFTPMTGKQLKASHS